MFASSSFVFSNLEVEVFLELALSANDIVVSQNHKTAEVVEDLKYHPVASFGTSRDGASTTQTVD